MRPSLIAGAAAAALVVAACGGGGGSGDVEAFCSEYKKVEEELAQLDDSDPDAVEAVFDHIDGLDPPDEIKDEFRTMIEFSRTVYTAGQDVDLDDPDAADRLQIFTRGVDLAILLLGGPQRPTLLEVEGKDAVFRRDEHSVGSHHGVIAQQRRAVFGHPPAAAGTLGRTDLRQPAPPLHAGHINGLGPLNLAGGAAGKGGPCGGWLRRRPGLGRGQ